MKKFLSVSLVLLIATMSVSAQSREFIREKIKDYGSCKNVAITKTNGDLMLYGSNGYASNGCPADLNSALRELHDNSEEIQDVVLTENGSWLLLYGANGFRWNDIPSSLEAKITYFNDMSERIDCASFNDYGDWIVITENYYACSDEDCRSWLRDGEEEYGELWTACVTNDCVIAVYAGGFKFMGDYPSDLRKALTETSIDVFRLKVAGTAWFFANKQGDYNYNM